LGKSKSVMASERRACYESSMRCANSVRVNQSAIADASRRASVTRAAVSGVIGSRAGATKPMVCAASGSTIGIDRSTSVRPSVAAKRAGITLAHRPVRTCEYNRIIESDTSVIGGLPPA
jgi:hypothetical protein